MATLNWPDIADQEHAHVPQEADSSADHGNTQSNADQGGCSDQSSAFCVYSSIYVPATVVVGCTLLLFALCAAIKRYRRSQVRDSDTEAFQVASCRCSSAAAFYADAPPSYNDVACNPPQGVASFASAEHLCSCDEQQQQQSFKKLGEMPPPTYTDVLHQFVFTRDEQLY